MFLAGEAVVFELQRIMHFDNAAVHEEGFRQDAD